MEYQISEMPRISHILIPETYRLSIFTSLSASIPIDVAFNTISNNIYSSNSNYFIHILYKRLIHQTNLENNNNTNYYVFIYFKIPKDLITQLLEKNIIFCQFYISILKNVEIRDTSPNISELSRRDNNGNLYAYESRLIDLKTI